MQKHTSSKIISGKNRAFPTGIQKRYLEATKRRKEVFLYKEFLLINLENGVNANINIINVNINPINDTVKGILFFPSKKSTLAAIMNINPNTAKSNG